MGPGHADQRGGGLTAPAHGAALRGLAAEASGGRFGRMFPDLDPCPLDDDAVEALVALMARPDDAPANSRIPAGFTYLGQFVDHDITFDPTSRLDRDNDPRALRNFRTPRLDLDSVYGAGPLGQPYLYDWEAEPAGVRLLVGRGAGDACDDLPRNHRGRALIGDPRNDDNVIVSQLHLLFLRFHNAVVEHVRGDVAADALFDHAQRLVRRHYQWIVAEELLPRLVGAEVAARARERREHFTFEEAPSVPVEFSGAAYRFGHSMVREQYGMKRLPAGGGGPPGSEIFPDLGGLKWMAADVEVDWERFFRLPGAEAQVQPSQRINPRIVGPLYHLPDGGSELPRRNLLRGRALGLPSGQAVARAMEERVLEPEELGLGDAPAGVREGLSRATPLWYYVLAEAEHAAGGRHLGPVGGRIVAEVLVGLLDGDPSSFVRAEEPWRPGELGTGETFTMAALIDFVRRSPS